MKSSTTLFFCLLMIQQFLSAQDSSLLKRISFRIAIAHTGETTTRGWLANIRDSSVLVSDRAVHFASAKAAARALKEIDYASMARITVKRNNGGGRGALIGALSGLFIGAVAGLIDGDDPVVPASQDYFGLANAFHMSAGEKALVGGFAGAAVGSGIGAIIGSIIKKTFIIGGKKEKFDELRVRVLDKAYRTN